MIKLKKINPSYIYKNNKPIAAIIDIKIFKEIMERLEDDEDVSFIKAKDKESVSYRKFSDYLSERANV